MINALFVKVLLLQTPYELKKEGDETWPAINTRRDDGELQGWRGRAGPLPPSKPNLLAIADPGRGAFV